MVLVIKHGVNDDGEMCSLACINVVYVGDSETLDCITNMALLIVII